MKDWRGVELEVGQTVIYGAPVSRSISPVEGKVEGFSKTGKTVQIRIVRYAFGYRAGKDVVNVMPGRLTVVAALPEAEDKKTMRQEIDDHQAAIRQRQQNQASHMGVDVVRIENPVLSLHRATYEYKGCSVCGCTFQEAYLQPCPRAAS